MKSTQIPHILAIILLSSFKEKEFFQGSYTLAKSGRKLLFVSLAILAALFLQSETISAAYGSGVIVEGMEVQAQGQIHEAFADVSMNKVQPLTFIPHSVPEPINEIPPDVRPEGEWIEWIPGYWSWDESQDDFIWISGVWRDIPPDRKWNSGYWMAIDGGYQYIPGYWAPYEQFETEYLPPPPEPLNENPSSPSFSSDDEWMKGSWVWNYNHYVWQSGYWYEHSPDMVWVASHYVRTPRGYIFVSGYWDYHLTRRGVMYAPIYYTRPIYRSHDYFYTPRITLDFDSVFLSLFVRRGGHHYYFGNYHHVRHVKRGFYPWYSKHATKYGHDPHYKSYRSHRLRHDREWEKKYHRKFQQHRNHKKAGAVAIHRMHKDRNHGHASGAVQQKRDRRFEHGGQSSRKALRIHTFKPHQKGKFRSHDRKLKKRTAESRKVERVKTKERRIRKNTVTVKHVQQKRFNPSVRVQKKHSNGKRYGDSVGKRSQPARFKHMKPERKRQFKAENRKSNKIQVERKNYKSTVVQKKKSWKPAYSEKPVGQKKSVSRNKGSKKQAPGYKRSGNNHRDRYRVSSKGQNRSRHRAEL